MIHLAGFLFLPFFIVMASAWVFDFIADFLVALTGKFHD